MCIDRKGLMLSELILVVIIVGTIVAFAIPGYLRMRQRVEGRQASAHVKLLSAAEEMEHLENSSYAACNGFAACNATLELDLPNDGWMYRVTTPGAGFNALAMKDGCRYNMRDTDSVPNVNAGCLFVP